MKSFFNKKLYWEGLKKTRVVGIASAAITAIISALIPLISMLDWYSIEAQYRTNRAISAMEFCIPALLLIMPTAVLTVLNMFSYLNKRSDSDFYHAIPFKRSCVFISFMAACLSWLVVTAALSIFAAAFFYWIHPGATVALSIPFINLGICILLGASLAATTAVAMNLTGTSISNLLITVLMIAFVPVVGFLFITALDQIVPILYVPLTPARFLLPEFSMPIAVMEVMVGCNEAILYSNAPMIIYTLIVTLVMLVIGCLTYMIRKSEMASQSAPNKFLQHVYRCAVSLPFALFAVMFIVMEADIAAFIVFAVITLLVYFMYELITTKRFKNLAKAIPFLGVLVAGALIFFGSAELTKVFTLAYTPEASEIESIGNLSDDNYQYYGFRSFESIKTDKIEIENDEARQIVSDALKDSVERLKNDTFYSREDYYYDGGDYSFEEYEHTYRIVKLTDQSGKVCGRQIRLSVKDDNRLSQLFIESDDYANALIQMPSEQEIQSICAYGNHWIDFTDEQLDKIWKSFTEEYNTLTREQMLTYKSGIEYDEKIVVEVKPEHGEYEELPTYTTLTTFEVSGTVGTTTFCSDYELRTDLFPKTCTLFIEMFNSGEFSSNTDWDGGHQKTFGIDSLKEILPLLESERMNAFNISVDYEYFYHDNSYAPDTLSSAEIAKLREIIEFTLDCNTSAAEADYFINLETFIYLDNYETAHDNYVLVALTSDDYKTLQQMITDFYLFDKTEITQ